ncbi:hypothetical protein GCM10022242_28960 [Nocardioides panacisoli]|uniref:ARB-07466-like C-terminal domain-containing protein n=1 Tax=Nocardioides panacisoli TaxID=627624 RepID=A0ABP7ISX2_9ACTN
MVVGLAAMGIIAVVGVAVLQSADEILAGPSGDCDVTVAHHEVKLSGEQAENAALITALSIRRGLPARAASIALATAYQESDLYNIDYGDRDSVGLFQQRPSQGWGSREQLLDPVYATNAFYDALQRVDGYENMDITVAAQTVQHSQFPDAYADHEADARTVASSLTGYSPATFSCDLDGGAPSADDKLTSTGLTSRADAVRKDLAERFGEDVLASAHYDGRAVEIYLRPENAASKVRGWALAEYLVANAARLDVRTVGFDGRVWRAGEDGWHTDTSASGGDHLHVDVFS